MILLCKGLCLIIAVVCCVLTGVSGESTCLSCADAVHPRDCTKVTPCSSSHSSCYTDAYVTNLGSFRYNLGCRDTQQCANTSSISGRSTKPEDLECTECCTGDLCNNALCNQNGYAPRYSRGPICYNCPRQQTTDDCQVITACGRDEVCKLKRVLVVFGSHQEIQYETMCEYKQKCEGEVNFYGGSLQVVGRKRSSDQFALGGSCLIQCCTDDLCNIGCTDTTVAPPTLSCHDEPSCSLLMSSYDVCTNTPVARQFCARSCGLCPGSQTTIPVWTDTTTSTRLPTTTTTMATMTTTTTTMATMTTTTTTATPLTTSTPSTTTFYIPTYGPELANLLYVGAKVVRGKDWKWGDQDHGGEGTIVSLPSNLSTGWLRVKWADNSENSYRMGREGAFDLMLVPGSYNPPSTTSSGR